MNPGSFKPEGLLSRLRIFLSHRAMRAAGFTTALLVAVGLVVAVTAVEMTSRPRFCGSCHIMAPYYESWKHSSHKNIACVDCHIPPGVTAEIRKKYEALSMVARYFTGTYGTNPWAEIEDAACLRCHERRLLSGTEMIGDVLFDHGPHLSEMRRGKTLRCTSCHGQLVQGSHIAVTTSTCILCHFKDQEEGEDTARCTLCHHVPEKTYQVGMIEFNHADVARFGMECSWCHARPEGSNGEVPHERCVTCHNQMARLEKYDDTELLHRAHVSGHKIDCVNCHLQLEHVAPMSPKTAKTVEAQLAMVGAGIHQAASECRSCHEAGHSPQLALYTGTGGRGVDPMPSVMFQAGVRCEGCHIELPTQQTDVNRASDVSCMACHGHTYRKIYLNWKAVSTRRSEALERQLDETSRALAGSDSRKLADARFNQSLVARGEGVHNIPYSYALLRKAHDDMNAARRDRGLEPLPRPWMDPPYESSCFDCHEGIEGQSGRVFDKPFAHATHVVKNKLDCEKCHRPHAEKPEGELLRFDDSGCVSCHHEKPVKDCAACHGDVLTRKVQSYRGRFDHEIHIEETELGCVGCHDLKAPPPGVKKSVCLECHD